MRIKNWQNPRKKQEQQKTKLAPKKVRRAKAKTKALLKKLKENNND